MPRTARIEFPGETHHIMARGLDGMCLFETEEEKDRLRSLIKRYVIETQCRCHAWAIMDNHYHLLMRTGPRRLGETMLRIHTAYASYFNRRHGRRGYVFEDRYKSIVTADGHYLCTLTAYIHANPLRAGIVKDMRGLRTYAWCGHGMVVQGANNGWFYGAESLRRFGSRRQQAQKEYLRCLGGLRVSDYSEEPLHLRVSLCAEEERTLPEGLEGEFKSLPTREAERFMALRTEYYQRTSRRRALQREGWDVERVAKYVCGLLGVSRGELIRRGNNNTVSDAKGLVCHWSYRELGISMRQIGSVLGIRNSSVSRCAERGRRLAVERKLDFRPEEKM